MFVLVVLFQRRIQIVDCFVEWCRVRSVGRYFVPVGVAVYAFFDNGARSVTLWLMTLFFR